MSRQSIEIKVFRFILEQYPEKTGYEYGKSIFNTDIEAVCNVDISQNINIEFEIEGVKYYLDENDLNDPPSQSSDMHFEDT